MILGTVLITGIAGHAALSPAYIILARVGQRPAVLSCKIDKWRIGDRQNM